MNLTQLSKRLNLGSQYVRKLVTSGRIKSTIVPVNPGSNIKRHDITEEAVLEFLK